MKMLQNTINTNNIYNKQFNWIFELIKCINRKIALSFLHLNIFGLSKYRHNNEYNTDWEYNFYANCYCKCFRQLVVNIFSTDKTICRANIVIYNLIKPRVYNKRRYRRFRLPERYVKNPAYIKVSVGPLGKIPTVQLNKPYKKDGHFIRYIDDVYSN